MKIDPATGRVTLEELGLALGPALTRAQFLRCPVAAASLPGAHDERWFRYQLPVLPQRDTELYVVLHFDRERLSSLGLFHSAARFGNAWAGWTEAHEMARKVFHEQWLDSEMGLPCGRYRWGEVRSQYDPGGGASSVTISYPVRNAWQVAGRAAGRLWGAAASRL